MTSSKSEALFALTNIRSSNEIVLILCFQLASLDIFSMRVDQSPSGEDSDEESFSELWESIEAFRPEIDEKEQKKAVDRVERKQKRTREKASLDDDDVESRPRKKSRLSKKLLTEFATLTREGKCSWEIEIIMNIKHATLLTYGSEAKKAGYISEDELHLLHEQIKRTTSIISDIKAKKSLDDILRDNNISLEHFKQRLSHGRKYYDLKTKDTLYLKGKKTSVGGRNETTSLVREFLEEQAALYKKGKVEPTKSNAELAVRYLNSDFKPARPIVRVGYHFRKLMRDRKNPISDDARVFFDLCNGVKNRYAR